MTYPIPVDGVLERITDENFRELMGAILPAVNDCYTDGREGADFTFQDEPAEAKTWEGMTGRPMNTSERAILHNMIGFCRDAYEQGRKEATA